MDRLARLVGLAWLATAVCLVLASGDAMAARKDRGAKDRSHEIGQAKERAKQFRLLNSKNKRTMKPSRRARQFPQIRPRLEKKESVRVPARAHRNSDKIRKANRVSKQVRIAKSQARAPRVTGRSDWRRQADRVLKKLRMANRRSTWGDRKHNQLRNARRRAQRSVHVARSRRVRRPYVYAPPPGPVYVERDRHDDRTFEKVMLGIQTVAILLNELNGILPPPAVGYAYPVPPPGLPY